MKKNSTMESANYIGSNVVMSIFMVFQLSCMSFDRPNSYTGERGTSSQSSLVGAIAGVQAGLNMLSGHRFKGNILTVQKCVRPTPYRHLEIRIFEEKNYEAILLFEPKLRKFNFPLGMEKGTYLIKLYNAQKEKELSQKTVTYFGKTDLELDLWDTCL